MQSDSNNNNLSKISVLVVDDSLVFRRFLRDIFEDCNDIEIVGEAQNGIEALDMVLKTDPHVILLDVEMPIMDGMTGLQHLMIHRPTPTIMFSSLTHEGTARCFDTLKNGAVDFVCKDFLFQEKNIQLHRKLVVDKVRKASRLKVNSRDPAFTSPGLFESRPEQQQRVLFCEDCGHKEVVAFSRSKFGHSVTCSNCGDTIELTFTSQYRRNTFVTLIGGGEGSFYNLLEIIPKLESEMGGAIIVVIHGKITHIDAFAEYLDAISSMKVIRAREGVSVEGGNCYLVSGQDYMCLKPYSAQLTLKRLKKVTPGAGPLDVLAASVSAVCKKKTAGIIISGDEPDGGKGMSILQKNEGTILVLEPTSRLCKGMGNRIMKLCKIESTESISALVDKIKKLHYTAKDDAVAG